MEKKSSEQWQNAKNSDKKIITVVLDPDGWDRSNFQFSWFEEEITEAEFNERRLNSTSITYRKPE